MQISPVKFPQLPVFSNKATEDEFLPEFRLDCVASCRKLDLNSESLDKVASVSGAGNQQARQELSERTFSKSN